MKKSKITFILLIAALCTGLSAEAKFGIGPKIGLNVEKMSGKILNGNLSAKDGCGVTAGVTAEYMAPILGLGADISLMYVYMTNTVDGADFNGSFMEIPLNLKYKIGIPAISNILKPYVFTGPTVAFKLCGSEAYDKTKTTQWGWNLGVGLEFINHLQIGAGYTFGINNIVKDSYNVSDDIKIRNNYWTITAAWMF